MSDFDADRERYQRELADARAELEALLGTLQARQLTDARRGGWTVRRVLQHVIESERHYARLAAHLSGRGTPAPTAEIGDDAGPSALVLALEESRRALLAAVEGADEEAFYRLQRLGQEEYSIASLLENVANHDREHLGQIRGILGDPHR